MTSLGRAREYLIKHFGFADFRAGQAEVIEAVMAGRDSIVVMPTGGGKSLCYQLPAIMLDGAAIVISPLIALMKDQVDALRKKGITATFINSSLGYPELLTRLAGIRKGAFKIIYVAPERFRNEAFTDAINAGAVKLFAVDEAHCVSHWGHDFRPDYSRLAEAAKALGRPPIVALTATATEQVRRDMAERLGMSDPLIFVTGFDRPNLRLRVVHTGGDKEKLPVLKGVVEASQGPGIIYAATRKSVESISGKLKMAGFAVEPYHGGMTERERSGVQEQFMSGQTRAIIATNAFGMGVDKADIRFVVHYHMPGSIESYYQEIGRAGRDGAPADCFLFFNYADTKTQRFFIDGNHPSPDLIASVYRTIGRLGAGGNEVTLREIQSQLGVKNEMSVQTALSSIERAGQIERGRRTETVVMTTLSAPLDVGLGATSATSVEGVAFRHLVYAHDVSQSEPAEIDLVTFAREVGLDPPRARGALNKLAALGLLHCTKAYTGRGFRLTGSGGIGELHIDRSELSARATTQWMKLRKIIDYCYSKRCLRTFILKYFGDATTIDNCDSCSACSPADQIEHIEGGRKGRYGLGTLQLPASATGSTGDLMPDGQIATALPQRVPTRPISSSAKTVLQSDRITAAPETEPICSQAPMDADGSIDHGEEASQGIDGAEWFVVKTILGCVARLNGRFGKGTFAAVLVGAGSKEVTTHNLQRLPTYGLLSHLPAQEVAGFIKSLVKAGCIAVSNTAYPTLSITDLGRDVMHGAQRVRLVAQASAELTGE